jgi:hypothetical protein
MPAPWKTNGEGFGLASSARLRRCRASAARGVKISWVNLSKRQRPTVFSFNTLRIVAVTHLSRATNHKILFGSVFVL